MGEILLLFVIFFLGIIYGGVLYAKSIKEKVIAGMVPYISKSDTLEWMEATDSPHPPITPITRY